MDAMCCLACIYWRAGCYYISSVLSKWDCVTQMLIRCIILRWFVFCQDLTSHVSMLEADITKLKCHAERLMSSRHPAAATIQVHWSAINVTPGHVLNAWLAWDVAICYDNIFVMLVTSIAWRVKQWSGVYMSVSPIYFLTLIPLWLIDSALCS